MNDFRGIENLKTVIEKKMILTRKLLRLQLEILEYSETSFNVDFMTGLIQKCHQIEKECFDLDVLFLEYYQNFLETQGVLALETVDKSLLVGFKPIKQGIAEMQSLNEHLEIQRELVSQIEMRLLKQQKNRQNLSRYNHNAPVSKSKKE